MLEYGQKILAIQKELGVKTPIVVALTLTGTKNLQMAQDILLVRRRPSSERREPHTARVGSRKFQCALDKVLKPIFDLIWNACGFVKLKNFGDEGNWKPQR